MKKDQHPVWNVYDFLRTIRLNVKYNQHLLDYFSKLSMSFDLSLAIIAPSSSIATFGFWGTDEGKIVWQVLIAITAIIAFIKPFLRLNDKIKYHERLALGYDILYDEIISLKNKISNSQQYTGKHILEFEEIEKKRRILKKKYPNKYKDNKSLISKLCEEIDKELPNNIFFVPTDVVKKESDK